MGCGCSKLDESKLVVLCKERRDLIRDAVDRRYALAMSHEAYFRSLRGVGLALERFVEEELVVWASSGESSPVLTIPSSEGKGGSRSKSSAGGGGSTPRGSVSHSHLRSPEEEDNDGDDGGSSHLRFSEDSHLPLSSDEEEGGGGRQEEGVGEQYNLHSSPAGTQNPNYYYMNYMRHSTGIPSTVYQNPYQSGYDYTYPTYGGNEEHFGVPHDTGFPTRDPSSSSSSYYPYYNYPMNPNPRPASPPPPPPPPPPAGSTWDFLDFFGTYDQVYSNYRMGSITSSPNSSEVREKEGIPALEEEIEQDISKEKVEEENASSNISIKGKNLKASSSQEKDSTDHLSYEGRTGGSPECIASLSSGEGSVSKASGGEEELVRKKGVTFDMDTSLETRIRAALSIQGTRDVREVVKEIKEDFMVASDSGEELCAMLEVGKLWHQSPKALMKDSAVRVISSRIFHSLPTVSHSPPSGLTIKPSWLSARRTAKATHQYDKKSCNMKSGELSSTLEKLYVWENKLYKEVKDEEKLRIAYEKKFKRLKALDDRGVEPYKVDETRATLRMLTMKIDITIKSIDAISGKVQKLRDDELQPQLIELIHSWIRLWNSLLHCHRKQYQAIVDCKTRNVMAKTGNLRNSLAKATRELEMELSNWSNCFTEWISMQKTYLWTLNEWLFKWLDVKPEVTLDGEMPFSPGRVGAPAVFVFCNDWYQALNGISQDEVKSRILSFVDNVHNLWETQREEFHQRLKAERLSSDIERRLNSLQKDGTNLHVDAPVVNYDLNAENGSLPNEQILALDSMRNRLVGEKSKHEELVKQVHEAASRSLRAGLVPIFEALGNFTADMLKAYEELRIPSAGGHT